VFPRKLTKNKENAMNKLPAATIHQSPAFADAPDAAGRRPYHSPPPIDGVAVATITDHHSLWTRSARALLLLFFPVLPLLSAEQPPSPFAPDGTTCPQPYTITAGTDTIVPGTTDTGNHCDDCDTLVPLPFTFHLYDQAYTSVNVNSNGRLDFVTVNEPNGFRTQCLPAPPNVGPYDFTIFGLWHDQVTLTGLSGCASFPGGTCGIFTSTSGTAPNRIFNVEFRTVRFADTTQPENYEVRLYENFLPNRQFEIIYGALNGITGNVTAGVQGNSTAGLFTQDFCNTAPTQNVSRTYTEDPCPCPNWQLGPDLPTAGVRMVGVYFPTNNRFYAMGGRSGDTAGSDFTHPFEYDPSSDTWVTKTATYPDNQVNNMACGVLTESGTPFIYCVGGSAAGQTTATARVFFYNPVSDSIASLTSGDNWPGDTAGTVLPGGFAVVSNKLYILGGFNINVASTNQIWQFDPAAATGAKWTQRINTPEGIMFAPTCAIGSTIYVAGASDFSGGTVVDTTNSFSYNPGSDTLGTIAAIPRATGETRAVRFNGKMWVLGGGRVGPNPSTEVDIYDPANNTWATGTPFSIARRNFPADSDGSTQIFLAGGYDMSGVTPLASTEVFCGATPKALNISTRLQVQTGNNVLIGGFIVTGSAPKNVVVRGIGPSLGAFGIPNPLADPTLELHASNGTLIMQNDNWQDDPVQASHLMALGLAPTDVHESALIATLDPNASYTAIVAGKNGGTGVGLVEAYDTNSSVDSELANISTRGFVLTGSDVMIGGFILSGASAEVAVRGIGPSLSQFVSPALADPTLELHNGSGTTLAMNDNWQDDPTSAGQLTAHGLAPTDPLESGIFTTLPPGAYTAILAGKNGVTGIGLVEVYNVH
jgi:hypothetical protein